MNDGNDEEIILSQNDFVTPASPKQNQDHTSWAGGN